MLKNLFIAFATFFFAVSQANAEDTIQFDQGCVTEAFESPINIPVNVLSQTFTPAFNHLTQIKIYVKGDGSGQVGLKLYRGDEFLARTELRYEPLGDGDITFSFDDVAVTPGDNSYKIRPYVSQGNTYLNWYRRTSCYDRGKAFEENVSQGYDFGFATYGYNFVVTPDSPDEVSEEESGDDEEEEEEDEEEDEEEEDSEDGEDEEEVEEEEENKEEGETQAEESQDANQESVGDGNGVGAIQDDVGDQEDLNLGDQDGDNEAQQQESAPVKSIATEKEKTYSTNEMIEIVLFAVAGLLFVLTVGYLIYRKIKGQASQTESDVINSKKVKGWIAFLVIGILSLTLLGLIWFGMVDDEVKSSDFEFSRSASEVSGGQIVEGGIEEESLDLMEFRSEKYGYFFKYPKEVSVKKATKEFFTVTPQEHQQGVTAQSKLNEYSGDICLIIDHMHGTIRISASPNKNKDVVMCAGITGMGSDCTLEQKTENIEIGNETFESKGNAITCPGSDYREVFVISFDDGTSIEYIIRKSEGMSEEDFEKAKNEIIEIVSSFRLKEWI